MMNKPQQKKENKMVTCETCNKPFANNWGLKVHKARTHDKKPKAEKPVEATPAQPVAKTKKVSSPVVVQFCPCCGLNMAAVTVAVNYARK